MKRGLAAVASLAVAALTLVPAGPAGATPQPRDEEWWFSSWGIQKMAWPVSTGSGVTVAVVDSGVNARLPELRGAVVPGFNAAGGSGDGRTDTDTDLGGHGTAMAALIAGQGGSARMVGVAPDAKIMPIVSDGYADSDTKAIRFAVDHGAKVVSISQVSPDRKGQTCDADLQQAIAYAAQKNVVVVAAAGNEGQKANSPEYPASCAGVLAVGAIDNHLKIWPDTENQPYVAAAAPGWGVGSIGKTGRFMNNISGTSQSAALTSGAVALVRAKYPDLSARDLVQRIIATAVDCGPAGVDGQTGAGAVLPPPALTKTVEKTAPNPPFERLDKWLATQNKQPADSNDKSPAAAGKSDSGSSSGALLPILLVVILVAVVVAVIVVLRRRRGGAPVVSENPNAGYPNNQYAGTPPDRRQGPPPSFGPPGGEGGPYGGPPPGHPRNTPPSFRPPDDRGGPTQG
jgi:type VII secretion-associated serine protease mycosin